MSDNYMVEDDRADAYIQVRRQIRESLPDYNASKEKFDRQLNERKNSIRNSLTDTVPTDFVHNETAAVADRIPDYDGAKERFDEQLRAEKEKIKSKLVYTTKRTGFTPNARGSARVPDFQRAQQKWEQQQQQRKQSIRKELSKKEVSLEQAEAGDFKPNTKRDAVNRVPNYARKQRSFEDIQKARKEKIFNNLTVTKPTAPVFTKKESIKGGLVNYNKEKEKFDRDLAKKKAAIKSKLITTKAEGFNYNEKNAIKDRIPDYDKKYQRWQAKLAAQKESIKSGLTVTKPVEPVFATDYSFSSKTGMYYDS